MVQNSNGTWRTVTTTRTPYQPLGFSLSVPLQFDFSGPPENCGAAYASLVQTADGRTADSPWGGPLGIACTISDENAWYAKAREVFGLVRAAWNSLMALDNAAGDWSATREVSPTITEYDRQHGNLEEPSLLDMATGNCTAKAHSYIANIEQGACALHYLNHLISQRGQGGEVVIPDRPAPPPNGGGAGFFAAGGVAVLVLALGALYLAKK